MNDYHFKLVRSYGDFVWHRHPATDEVFIVIDGNFQIDLRDKRLYLIKGDMVVISKRVEHKPYAREECKILLIERRYPEHRRCRRRLDQDGIGMDLIFFSLEVYYEIQSKS